MLAAGTTQSKADHRWVTTIEFAKFANVTVRTVYRWIEAGVFGEAVKKMGSQWRIDLDAYLAS